MEECRILILTQDNNLKNYLQTLFQGEGYQLEECKEEGKVTEILRSKKSNLLIIDFEYANAIEICKKVRANFTLRYIPVIVLINKEQTIEKIKCMYAGADDYIEKPIQGAEILTRIKANLWRANRDLDANPLTKLPGNVTILKELEKKIKDKEIFSVAYVDLDKFKEYNDYYGFEWGDKVIKHTAKILTDTLQELGAPNDFLGHIGGDDFIFITSWECIDEICKRILEDFDSTILSFYTHDDLKKGYIIVKNRAGKVNAIPMLTISIGVATNKKRLFTHVAEIIQTATELKNYAKSFQKSIYTTDRRKI